MKIILSIFENTFFLWSQKNESQTNVFEEIQHYCIFAYNVSFISFHLTQKSKPYLALKQKIKELDEKADFYKMIADNTYDCELFRDTLGKIIYANKAFERITGYKVDDFLNGRISEDDILHPDDIEMIKQIIQKALNKKTQVDFTFRIIRNDGKIRIVNACSQPVYKKGKFWGSRSSLRDITDCQILDEIKIAKEKAESNEHLLLKIAENFPNSYISVIEKNFIISFSSGAEFKKNKLNPKDFEGLSLEQVFGKHTSIVKKHYKKTFEGEETTFELFINNQFQIYRTYPIFEHSGSVNRILSVVENITERKKTEQMLLNSIGFLNNTAKLSKIGGWSLNLITNELTWSKETYRIHEVPADYVPDLKTAISFYHPDYKHRIAELLDRLIITGEPFIEELKFISAKGNKKWVRAIGEAIKAEGITKKIVGTFQDITVQKKRFEEEKELIEKKFLGSDMKLKQEISYSKKMIDDLNVIYEDGNEETKKMIALLKSRFKTKESTDIWNEFELHFEKINLKFYEVLSQKFPMLTGNELRLCAFYKHNLSNKEIAIITLKTDNTLKKARQRLRVKLGIESTIKLTTFLNNL